MMKRKRKAWIYSPEGFDVADHGLPLSLENEIRWLLSTIYFRRAITNRRERSAFFPLPAQILAQVYGDVSKVKPVREACVLADLIEVDNRYIVGKKSIGYRLGPALRECKFQRWYGDGGKVFLNRFARFKAEWTTTKGLDALGIHLRRWCERVSVAKEVTEALKEMPEEKRQLAEHQIEMIRAGMIRAKFCRYGRYHTNFTGLCREIRLYLEIGGKRLHEIDIVGSQTLFLAGLLTSHSRLRHTPATPLPYDFGIQSNFGISVASGTVYEDFQRHHGFPSREAAKEKFFHAVYGTPDATEAFRAVWPEEGNTLRRLKRQHGYKWVPREMQRRESQLFLRVAIERLRHEHPGVPIITVHDSAMTTEEQLPLVECAIREAFVNFPFKPRLRIRGEIR